MPTRTRTARPTRDAATGTIETRAEAAWGRAVAPPETTAAAHTIRLAAASHRSKRVGRGWSSCTATTFLPGSPGPVNGFAYAHPSAQGWLGLWRSPKQRRASLSPPDARRPFTARFHRLNRGRRQQQQRQALPFCVRQSAELHQYDGRRDLHDGLDDDHGNLDHRHDRDHDRPDNDDCADDDDCADND